MTKNKCNKKGFTLIELLAIILIISLILGISGSYIISTINTSKEKSGISICKCFYVTLQKN